MNQQRHEGTGEHIYTHERNQGKLKTAGKRMQRGTKTGTKSHILTSPDNST